MEFEKTLGLLKEASPFLCCSLQENPGLLPFLEEHFSKERSAGAEGAFSCSLAEGAFRLEGEDLSLALALARARRALLSQLMLSQVSGRITVFEAMQVLSDFADLAICRAIEAAQSSLAPRFGVPLGETSGTEQRLAAVALGKLGGRELNFSSDIDLVFLYPEEGRTTGPKSISNQEYFIRLAKDAVRILDSRDWKRRVFRVDLRLRPWGNEGLLALPLPALENYLLLFARPWERLAWVRARAVGKEDPALLDVVHPFVFRRTLDFALIEDLRGIKREIASKVRRQGLENDLKLGPGGIREAEFIVQAFQVIRGGVEPALRTPSYLLALSSLGRLGYLEEKDCLALEAGYLFLRRLENAIQFEEDLQTHVFPGKKEKQAHLARMLAMSPEGLKEGLAWHRSRIEAIFSSMFASAATNDMAFAMDKENTLEGFPSCLRALGYADPQRLCRQMADIDKKQRDFSSAAKTRLFRLAMEAAQRCQEKFQEKSLAEETLFHFFSLLEKIVGRAGYVFFLLEQKGALEFLLDFLAKAPVFGKELARDPMAIEILADARSLFSKTPWEKERGHLAERMALAQDEEARREALRHFRDEHFLRLCAQYLEGLLEENALGQELSRLAESVLQATLVFAWQEISRRHEEMPRVALVGYGRLGSEELGFSSDLDLVFLYDDPHPEAPRLYARLAKRLHAWISGPSEYTRLFPVDLRLRPDGTGGLLVTSLESFSRYQFLRAWVWEKQALVRARFCAGDPRIGEAFEKVRREALRQPLPPDWKRQVLAMREKMRVHHGEGPKHGPGGQVDAEFLAQYGVLAHARDHPEILMQRSAANILGFLGEKGLFPEEESRAAARGWILLQRAMNESYLAQKPARVPEEAQRAILRLWDVVFFFCQMP